MITRRIEITLTYDEKNPEAKRWAEEFTCWVEDERLCAPEFIEDAQSLVTDY